MDAGGDASAVVDHADAVVGEQRDVDLGRVTCQGLVHRVVHDLLDEMVKTALTGGADIHTRALANRLKPLEYGD
ncbi:hypothetical protein GCM10009733_054630 [Nonomuraea maheshkhaliensis]|uniref:Uncharacterized protein n=1 Tax=Nonomuraea maheshkhaliensis TaxID=419590 RepID=A0ABN2FLH5_9ACTN